MILFGWEVNHSLSKKTRLLGHDLPFSLQSRNMCMYDHKNN